MRGKKKIHKSRLKTDPRYGSTEIAKFINYLMKKGKKSVAQAIVYKALEYVSSNTKQDALDIFDKAVKNVAPAMEVKSRRIGGANYQIPIAVRGDRRNALVFRWIINAARVRKGKPMYLKLGDEIIAAAENRGDAIKKKEDVQRMAEANRAFAHFAR